MFDLEFFVDRVLLNNQFVVEVRINTRTIGSAEQELLRRMDSLTINKGTSGPVWRWKQVMVSAEQLVWMHSAFKPSNIAMLRQRTDRVVKGLIEQLPQEPQPVVTPTLCLVMPKSGQVIAKGITKAITPSKKRRGKPATFKQVDLEVA